MFNDLFDRTCGDNIRRAVIRHTRALGARIVGTLAALVAGVLLVPSQAAAQQQGDIITVAGGGPAEMLRLNGSVTNAASTGEVGQIAWDGARQVVYFTSRTFHRVYKYDPAIGRATILAGNGFEGFAGDGGAPAAAAFAQPLGLAIDPTNANFLYVADTGNNRVRRIDLASNVVETVFGNGACNAGELTSADVAATSAHLCAPGQLAIDGSGILYVFDLTKSAVWRVASNQAHMIAGNGAAAVNAPAAGGSATAMSLGNFSDLAVDAAGRFLYLNEFFGLRQLNLATGTLSAPLDLGATSSPLRNGSPVAVDPSTGHVIYAIYPVPPAGGGTCDPQTDPTCTGGGGGSSPVTESIFSYDPSAGTKTQIAGQGSTSAPFLTSTSNVNLGLSANGLGELVAIAPAGGIGGAFVASRSGWIHSMDSLGSSPGFLTLLGNGLRSYCGDGGPATAACLDTPTSVAPNADGTFFIVDSGNGVVRFVDSAGNIHSLVSPKTAGAPPTSVAVLPDGIDTAGGMQRTGPSLPPGTLLFTSASKNQVFVLDPVNDVTTLYSGKGCAAAVDINCSPNDDAGLEAAAFNQPHGIAVDAFENPFVADTLDEAVRCLQCTDSVITVAGGPPFQGSDPSSGRPSQQTALNGPIAVVADTDNGLLIAEREGQTVRRVSPDPQSGYLYPFNPKALIVSDVLPASSGGANFSPVGVAVIPGHVLVSDAGTSRVLSTTRADGACTAAGVPVVAPFAGGGTDFRDNVPALQAAFGPAGSLSEIASATVNGHRLVYITDLASNRIRQVDAGINHPPVANAGVDQTITPDGTGFAHVTLDGSASTDPDCDALTYKWSAPGLSETFVGKTVQINLFGAGSHTFTLTVADGFGGMSTATVHVTVVSVDIGITATASAATIDPGALLTYSAVVTNSGLADATGVGVTMLSATNNFVSATTSQGSCTGPANGAIGYVQCFLGNLAHGASANILITLRPLLNGLFEKSLNVFSDQPDSNADNDSVTLDTNVGSTSGGGGGGSGGGSGGSGSGTCGCVLTGNYVDPSAGVDVAGDPLASPNNKFTVSATIDNANNHDTITITRNSDNAVLLPGTTFPITAHWGFSPDGNRIAIHAVAPGTQEDEMWVYDLSVSPAKQVVHYQLPVVSDRLQFSASGQYLVLLALVAQGRTEIDIYRVAGVSAEERVFQSSFPFQTVPGVDEDEFGAIHWGFSPDRPETSFVYAFVDGQNQASLNIANLTSPHTVPVLTRDLAAISAFWQFNPCGNLLGVVSQPFANKVDVELFSTGNGARVGADNQFPLDFVALSSTSAGEVATVGFNAPFLLAANPSCAPNTSTGSNITIQAIDGTTGTSPISVTFASVTQAGNTSVLSSDSGNPPPAGFKVGDPPLYYEVATSAVYAGQVIVCISYAGVTFSGSPQIFHFVNGAWVNSTTSVDAANKTVCAAVTSLSPFALFEPINHPPTADAGTNQTVEATSAAGAMVALSGSGSDPDNDPLTFTWSEGGTTLGQGAQLGVTLGLGVHTITLTTDDGHGGTATSTVQISVQDTTPPVLALPPSLTLEATSGAGAAAGFSAGATDAVDGPRPATCVPASGSVFPLGATSVSCSASDTHGNTASGGFGVTVRDTTPPSIDAHADVTVTSSSGSVIVTYTAPSTHDLVDGTGVAICSPASGSLFPVGVTTVTCTATDAAGNHAAPTTFSVIVAAATRQISRFVAFSRDMTSLGDGAAAVTGDVGANERRSEDHHAGEKADRGNGDEVTVRIATGASVQQFSSRVVGDTVLLLDRSSVHNVVDNFVTSRHGSTILGTVTTPMPVPFTTFPAFPAVTPGTGNVSVARNRTLTLPAGRYGAVHVGASATLILTGGLYQVSSLEIDESATVLFHAAAEIRVKAELESDTGARLILDPAVAGLAASQVVIYVEGRDADCHHDDSSDEGDDDAGPAAVHVGSQSVVQANIYAPNGTVWLKSRTQATGAFLGAHVRIGAKVTLVLSSAF